MPHSSLSPQRDSTSPRLAAKRLLVIYNPVAGSRRGRKRRYEAVLARLRAAECEITVRETTHRGDAEDFAAGLTREDCDLLVVAGGDGTINEVANGLIDRPLPLAIAPLGTANVLAWELGHGLTITGAARTVGSGRVVRIRPALAGRRGFLLMASAGIDARVVAGVNTALKRRIGKLAYGLTALREILRPPGPRIELDIDGRIEHAALAVVTHAAHYAGPFVIAPEARLGDDRLTVVLVRDNRRIGLILCGIALLLNRIPRRRGVDILPARTVRFLGPPGEPVQSDGDVIGHMPMEVRLGEGELSLIVADPDRVRGLASRELDHDRGVAEAVREPAGS